MQIHQFKSNLQGNNIKVINIRDKHLSSNFNVRNAFYTLPSSRFEFLLQFKFFYSKSRHPPVGGGAVPYPLQYGTQGEKKIKR